MRAHQLVEILGEEEVADLAARLDGVDGAQSQRVPEPNAPIGCPSATRKKTVLVR
eukprot:CAMPEP_0202965156 /NCGR_PEP_ID=MMETSP1396-20130829/9230_1 /ASSEMBLY_ACC=CAM_ASM_000872 /TAXON_ID= /ORGANISM="Pseudokeronopsis sp., Strain Brazil" /LENGTH=54 /DNA_ID=CAMNT_0049687789 /DNA_START=293 /DNA_END=457 /DNA_ORIENTATION=-